MDETTTGSRPWALRRWCVHLSWVLAAVVLLLVLLAPLIAFLRSEDLAELWIFVVLWPLFCALTFGVAWMMALIDRHLPISGMLSENLAGGLGQVLDRALQVMANVILIAGPVFYVPFVVAALLIAVLYTPGP